MRQVLGAVLLGAVAVTGFAQEPSSPGLRPPVTPLKGVRLTATTTNKQFDPKQVQLTVRDRRWALTHDGETIKDFGSSEAQARQALHLIQQLGLTEVARVGPNGGMEFWLANGNAPAVPVRSGLRTVAFDPAALRVERLQGQWCVRDDRRILSAFGPSEADAHKALEIVQQHGFTQAGLLGQPAPLMTVYFTSNAAELPTLKISRSSADSVAPDAMSSTRFPRLAKNKDGTPKVLGPKAGGLDGVSPPLIAPVPEKATKDNKRSMWRSQQATRAEVPLPTGRVGFDWRRVDLRTDQGESCLTAGTQVLAAFGGNVNEARTALSALRYYRCNEVYALPGDWASRWFVVPQVAPRTMMFGMHADPISPSKLQVVQVGARYALAEGDRVVLPMGNNAAHAAQLLEVMQQRQIDRITRVGPPGSEGIAFLLRSR